jgi:lipoprotein-releasing system ATP-binding protein
MLQVDHLSKDYPTRSGSLAVLRGITFTLAPGDALAITGPSGSGKSTLLHILGTLDRPTAGRLTLNGVNPFALDDTALAAFRNRTVGFVFQDHHLLPQFNVLENVLLPTVVAKDINRTELETRAKSLLERVGLAERLTHRPAELSGGERQRVALARALILNPPLLLADEPTGNLDRITAASIGDLLLDLHRRENTILIAVTHSQDLANRFTTRFEMNDGTLHPA